jgi:creatinine amidohydrolase
MQIEDITMEDYKRALKKSKTLIVPYGTVEEHGRHLPLSTDTLIIVEILKLLQKKRKVLIAPPIHYGVCTSTSQHPGTIDITPETLRRITLDIVRSAYRKGMRNFILVSGHGGGLHMSAIKEVAEVLVNELKRVKIAVLTPYDSLWKELAELADTENDSHAGEMETSMVLALRPELVKGRSKEEYPKFPKPLVVKEKLKYWPGGVWGNPKKASAEKGDKAVKLILKKLVEIVDRIEK